MLHYLYLLISPNRLFTAWTVLFHDDEGIEFAYGYLFHFFLTDCTVCHVNHLIDKNTMPQYYYCRTYIYIFLLLGVSGLRTSRHGVVLKSKKEGVLWLGGIPAEHQTRVAEQRPVGDAERIILFDGFLHEVFLNRATMRLSEMW